MYEEFVAAFAGDEKPRDKGPKAFVRGGTIQPGSAAPGECASSACGCVRAAGGQARRARGVVVVVCVLGSLVGLRVACLLPGSLAAGYGGGGSRRSAAGGWAARHLDRARSSCSGGPCACLALSAAVHRRGGAGKGGYVPSFMPPGMAAALGAGGGGGGGDSSSGSRPAADSSKPEPSSRPEEVGSLVAADAAAVCTLRLLLPQFLQPLQLGKRM